MKIEELELLTSNLEEITEFYMEVLELELINNILTTDYTNMKFKETDDNKPYHFAYNISYKKMEAALEWLEDRVDVLEYEGKKIVDYKSWNAKSIYFEDPDKNIVEFIGREGTEYDEEGDFTTDDIYEVSEIGIATYDVSKLCKQLEEKCNMPRFSGDFESFGAMGDDTGLFIIVSDKDKNWVPTEIKAEPADIKVKFTQDGKLFKLISENGVIEIK